VPAAAVIPALRVYITIVVVKTFVVNLRVSVRGSWETCRRPCGLRSARLAGPRFRGCESSGIPTKAAAVETGRLASRPLALWVATLASVKRSRVKQHA